MKLYIKDKLNTVIIFNSTNKFVDDDDNDDERKKGQKQNIVK